MSGSHTASETATRRDGGLAAVLTRGRVAMLLAVLALVITGVLGRGTEAGALAAFSTRFLGIFIEAVPFLLLGTVVSGLISAFVTPAQVARFAPRNPFAGAVMGASLGWLFPVCECGVVPVVRRLLSKGMPLSVGIAFLLAAPVMNVVVLFSTASAFGFGTVLAGRFLITVAVALTVGLIFSVQSRRQEVLRDLPAQPVRLIAGAAVDVAAAAPGAWRVKADAGVRMATEEFFQIGKFLVIGSLLAAGIQTLVSQDLVLSVGQGPVVSVLAMQALAYLLSVCSTVDSFLALAFTGTFTTGSILAFLTFGPMVDIKSTAMYLGIFRPRVVAYLVLLPLLMTLMIGVWFNLNVAG